MDLYNSLHDNRTFSEIWFGQRINRLDELVRENPNLASQNKGYAAEYIWRDSVAIPAPYFTDLKKQHDKDLSANGDWSLWYRKKRFIIEIKCCTAAKIKDGVLIGKVDIGHRDKKWVEFPCGGKPLYCRQIYRGEFDILAVNLFSFFGEHRWVYCLLDELESAALSKRRRCYKTVVKKQRESGFLVESNQKITWPLSPPWTENLVEALDAAWWSK